MKRFLCLIQFATVACGLADAKDAYPVSIPVASPDGLYESYSKPEGVMKDVNGNPYYFGEKVYVRHRGSNEIGLLLRENDRWMDVHWAPHSHLLGIGDNWDTHSSNVYVYSISLEAKSQHLQYMLVFQSPHNAYDVQWSIDGWNMPHRKIRLHCWGRYQPEGSGGYEFDRSFVIGTRALSEKE